MMNKKPINLERETRKKNHVIRKVSELKIFQLKKKLEEQNPRY